MTREDGLKLLKQHVETDRVMRHSLAVEAAMKAYAKKFGEDETRWGLIGLLHDIDFEKYPDVHPAKAPELLKEFTEDQSFVDTILSHGLEADIPRDLMERKCLHAVDEMASFIIAIALMRPTRLEGLKGKSVKKKMKDKAFAKAVNREELTSSMELLGVEFNDHIDTIVAGLVEQEAFLNESEITMLK
jgi:putative nucleotidyltransferase with HDIG domain